ncbi:MAG: flavodoxin family protein [Chloracidobacterium sp.]|uniref:Flavodoxin family protein n=1 Tax=Chloracidobacterium validum TaxID=2821543 RepID=A0ABX8BC46_9BACT|nr:flavodoxin family protein [Chloracidobacterium validum]QUW04507.1 flavodoxin family protein [Chloracidobacterium validum]
MITVVIVYHSGYGHTAAQAEAVLKGVQSVPEVSAQLIRVEDIEAHWATLDGADAIVFGSPTYMGSVSGPFKSFMDASSRRWLQQAWKDKIAAGFTNSGSLSGDKLNTLIQLAVFAAQHGMVWVGQAELPGGRADEAINRIGSMLGAAAQSDHGSGRPAEGDLATAEKFGARVALAAHRWKRGALA